MINPNKITNYNLSEAELQRQLVFWVLVAGKKAKTIAQRMKCVFNQLGDNNTKPFDLIKMNMHKKSSSFVSRSWSNSLSASWSMYFSKSASWSMYFSKSASWSMHFSSSASFDF